MSEQSVNLNASFNSQMMTGDFDTLKTKWSTNYGWSWPDTYHYYYPTYYPYVVKEDNKFEQAFKIVQKLMEKKLVDPKKVKDFIELVNEIVDVL